VNYHSQALSIFEALAQADPTNAGARSDLVLVHNSIGDVSLALGRVQEAYDTYAAALEISRDLIESYATHVGFQSDYAVGHHKLATAAAAMQDYDLAVEHYQSAIDLLDRVDPNTEGTDSLTELRQELSLKLWAFEAQAAEARVALADWETFINHPDADSLLPLRIELLAKEKRFDEIPQTADKLRGLAIEDPLAGLLSGFLGLTRSENLYNAACGYAICAAAIEPPEGEELTPEQQTQRQEYIDLALACLRESIAAGYSDFEHMQQDPDFDVLRDLPEFEELLPVSSGSQLPQ
jgi:tetratricopeptide (TPR) repeat protein